MKFKVDHDLHIHTYLSRCSNNPEQNPDFILKYAKENGIKTACITDHFWDTKCSEAKGFYIGQDFDHIASILPLPRDGEVELLFGCESDVGINNVIGVSADRYDLFDFIIIPTTHLHLKDATVVGDEDIPTKAGLWVSKFDAVLNSSLPFHKVGIPHPSCFLINKASIEDYRKTVGLIPADEMHRLFEKAAKLGIGIELNAGDISKWSMLGDCAVNIYRVAKECGCKFYAGSDAHNPSDFTSAIKYLDEAIEYLGITEDDKIPFLHGYRP